MVEALARLAGLASDADRAANRRVERLRKRAELGESASAIGFRRGILARIAEFDRAEVVRASWRLRGLPEAAMDGRRWRDVARRVVEIEGTATLAAGVHLVGRGDEVWISATPPADPPPMPTVALPVPGSATYAQLRIEAIEGRDPDFDESLDLDRLALPLEVGPPRPNERFDPLGMGGKTQSLDDFLRNRRIKRPDRPAEAIVRDRQGIVWVVGHRIGERTKQTPRTRRILSLRSTPLSPPPTAHGPLPTAFCPRLLAIDPPGGPS